ncbi:variant-specific surface protein VSP4A1-like [Boleophthalmus pectinirostris]|uniref:variant-specific surface protein VSP4A1-like n=1 Tax=Boleophthalmus pectinirostris TaxID=150288 RepID=UPI002431EDA8|nr:variant-specific surface protein VSP4A1-like [Boleophthalmus pectinirostris]
MMKTSVKLLTLVALFICVHSAAGLQCWSCEGSSCSSPTSQNCSSGETQCLSRTYIVSYNYGDYSSNTTSTYKGCASASECAAEGFSSYNYGPYSNDVNTTCCDTDNCNNENPSIVAPPVGSLQCYSCDPYSYECTANVTCNTQEVCGQAVDVLTNDQYNFSRPFYGCVSENLCNNTNLSQLYIGFSSPVSCCNTSHCNVPDLGLQCSTCTDSSCSSQRSVTCSKLAPFCYSQGYAVSNSDGSYSSSGIQKGCASPSVCTAAGSQVVSGDFGDISYIIKKTCCDTDDCNAPNPTFRRLQCISGSDSEQRSVYCPYLSTACISLSYTVSYNYGNYSSNTTSTYKGCASASECAAEGFSSYNYGPYSYDINTTCCDTDNCNNQNQPIVAPPVGSLQCYSCDPFTYECTANVSCNTQEVCGTGCG